MSQGRKENEFESSRIEKAKEMFKGNVKRKKVRLKVSMAGTLNGKEFSVQPGQVVEVDTATADQWVVNDHAEHVDKDTPIGEAATLDTNEFMMHDPRLARRMRGVA